MDSFFLWKQHVGVESHYGWMGRRARRGSREEAPWMHAAWKSVTHVLSPLPSATIHEIDLPCSLFNECSRNPVTRIIITINDNIFSRWGPLSLFVLASRGCCSGAVGACRRPSADEHQLTTARQRHFISPIFNQMEIYFSIWLWFFSRVSPPLLVAVLLFLCPDSPILVAPIFSYREATCALPVVSCRVDSVAWIFFLSFSERLLAAAVRPKNWVHPSSADFSRLAKRLPPALLSFLLVVSFYFSLFC